MISNEEIEYAQNLANGLSREDYSFMIVLVNKDVETKMLIAGDEDDVKDLMYRVEFFASNYNSNR